MASFEELYPSMAKRLAKHEPKHEPAHEFQVIEELPPVEATPQPVSEFVDLGGRASTQELADQWMTVKEAAQALGMVTETVYRMIKRQQLRSIRLGPRRIRVLKAD